MPPLKPYIALGAVAWVFGFIAYVASCAVIYHQSISPIDLVGVVQLSLMAFIPAYAFVYLPIFWRLQHCTRPATRIWLFPLVALPLAIVPTAFIYLAIGVPAALMGYGISASLAPGFFISPEASLDYCMYGAAGLVVAFGCALLDSRERHLSNR